MCMEVLFGINHLYIRQLVYKRDSTNSRTVEFPKVLLSIFSLFLFYLSFIITILLLIIYNIYYIYNIIKQIENRDRCIYQNTSVQLFYCSTVTPCPERLLPYKAFQTIAQLFTYERPRYIMHMKPFCLMLAILPSFCQYLS